LEFHRPKPLHSLREFLSEVAVVLLGIVIALAGEQALLSLESRHKIRLVAEEMRQEFSGDDGPQALERIALSKCVDTALDTIRGSAETNADRSAILASIGRFGTPRHTWDSIAFQDALSAGILAQMPTDRVDAMSRFYSLMPVLESANEREFRDGASLAAISRAGGPLTESERGQVLKAVETLRRDNAEIVGFSLLAESAMKQLGVKIADYRPHAGRVSSLYDPRRVINEMWAMPMAQQCVNVARALLADSR